MKYFSEEGLSVSYPDDWRIERERSENGWSVTLQSPGTGFAQIWLDHDMPFTEEVAATVLEALRDDYPSLEAESAIDMLAGEMAVGHDIQFISLDMVTTCWTRSFYSDAGTVLVLCQFNDLDDESCEPALRGICASLRTDSESTAEVENVIPDSIRDTAASREPNREQIKKGTSHGRRTDRR